MRATADIVRACVDNAVTLFSELHPEATYEYSETGLEHERLARTDSDPRTEWRWRWQIRGGFVELSLIDHHMGPYLNGHVFMEDRTPALEKHVAAGHVFGRFNESLHSGTTATRKLVKLLLKTYEELHPKPEIRRLSPVFPASNDVKIPTEKQTVILTLLRNGGPATRWDLEGVWGSHRGWLSGEDTLLKYGWIITVEDSKPTRMMITPGGEAALARR